MFEVRPYQGAGSIDFGMTQEQVRQILGVPKLMRKNWLKETELIYPSCNVCFGNNDQVTEISFHREAGVTLDGMDIMGAEGRTFLLGRCKEKYVGVGFIVLLDLGIYIGEDPQGADARFVTIFAKGRMDQFVKRFKRLE